ncbi:MAG: nitroreductase [Clostridia bacterium]|nr:nitroreductase [Clostridia bacterium]
MIYQRKSIRSYKPEPVSDEMNEKIRQFADYIVPLFPNLKMRYEIVDRKSVHSLLPWLPPQLIAVYAQEGDDSLMNVGFMIQQLELFLESDGLGTCWIGLGRPNKETKTLDGLRFVIYLAYGYPNCELYRKGLSEFNRRPMNEISDVDDKRLECARLAPSACNSQPWYFIHSDEKICVYRSSNIIIGKTPIAYFNNIDIGIALAHIYLSYEGVKFSIDALPPKKQGYKYMISITMP